MQLCIQFFKTFFACILSRKPLKESNTSVFRPMDAFSDLLNKIRRSLALKTVTFFHFKPHLISKSLFHQKWNNKHKAFCCVDEALIFFYTLFQKSKICPKIIYSMKKYSFLVHLGVNPDFWTKIGLLTYCVLSHLGSHKKLRIKIKK